MGVVESVHPSVTEKGLLGVIDPDIIRTVLGQGATAATLEPHQLAMLSQAVGDAQQLKTVEPSILQAARDELHKAFATMYPDAHPTPGSVTPGQFKRSYITAGRQTENSTSRPHIPGANSSVDAEEFDRSALTAGREAPSPANAGSRASSTLSAVDQLKAASRDQAAATMASLHDRIAAVYPNICALTGGSSNAAGFGGGVDTLHTDGSIVPITAGAKPKLTKAEKAEKRANRLEKQAKKARKSARKLMKAASANDTQEIAEQPDDATSTKLTKAEKAERKAARLEKQAKKAKKVVKRKAVEQTSDTIERPDGVKAAVVAETGEVLIDTAVLSDIVRSIVLEQTDSRFGALTEAIGVVQSDVEKLASEPDPAQAPVRGSVLIERAVPTNSDADVLRSRAEGRLADEVSYLQTLTKSGNAEIRMRAQRRLDQLEERSMFGEDEG